MWNEVVNLFREYMGTGLIVAWFLIALVYLFLTEKRRPMRIVFVYLPILLLLIFFNPLFSGLVYRLAGEETYYRILWLLPISVVIAFAAIQVLNQLEGVKKAAFGVTTALLIMVSGSFIYSNTHFYKAENLYHVPQCVVDICDVIEVEGREVKAIFPAELLQYVRQYSPIVCMPYGREILVSKWGQWDELYNVMEAEEINVEALVNGCRAQECVSIVLPEEKKVNGSFESYEYEFFAQVDKYVIYKDSTVNLTYFLEE